MWRQTQGELVNSYGVVNQWSCKFVVLYCALFEPKPQGELVDSYNMVNQQSCV